VKFSPTIIFFDSLGKEVLRMEGAFKSFHTHGIFRYVNDRAYNQQPSFQRYLGDLAEHYREQGLDVNIWSDDLAVSKDNQPVVPD
jgi:thioredoxin-related protein